MKTIIIIVIAATALSLFGEDMPDSGTILKLSPIQVQALVVATKALTSRSDYNSEQRSLSNYEVWIYKADGGIAVSFIAIPRQGDEATYGGNFAYARSVKYIIDERALKISKIVGSK
jgi:hypothetical protein